MNKTTIDRETVRTLAQALLKTRLHLEKSQDSAGLPWWHRDMEPRVRGYLMDWLTPRAGHDQDRLMALVDVLIFLMSVNGPWKIREGRLDAPEQLRTFAAHIAQTHYRDEMATLYCLCLWHFAITADVAAACDAAVSEQNLNELLKPVDSLPEEQETRCVPSPEPTAIQPPPALTPSPELAECPLCGKLNHLPETFRCRGCGRDKLCLRHQNQKSYLCEVCESGKELAAAYKNSIGMDFVLIQAGIFQRSETSDHEVTISQPFYLGKYAVTQAQWVAVMGNNPSKFRGANRPVERVSCNDAQEFINKLNAKEGHQRYRLPTPEEWEYAARAGSTTAYSFGDNTGQLEKYAWYYGNSGRQTQPVGQKLPNAWGLHDMHGNVWEWVRDQEDGYCGRCGGSWLNTPSYCRSDSWNGGGLNLRDDDSGFRLALSPH